MAVDISRIPAPIFSALSLGIKDPPLSLGDFNQAFDLNLSPSSDPNSILDQVSGLANKAVPSGAAGLGKHVLYSMYTRNEPIYHYCWFCYLPAVGGYRLPWNYVEEFTAPFRSFDVVNQYQRGKVKHYAGQHSVSNLSLRLYDDSSGKAGAYMENWRMSVMGKGGTYMYPRDYKKDIELIILDVSRFFTVYNIVYKGCWPVNSDPYNLASNSSDRIVMSAEFSVDDIEIRVRNTSIGGLANVLGSTLSDFPQSLVDTLAGTGDALTGKLKGVFSSDTSNPVIGGLASAAGNVFGQSGI